MFNLFSMKLFDDRINLFYGLKSVGGRTSTRTSSACGRCAMQHRGGVVWLAREKFAGAPSPQKKPISLF